MPKRALDGFIEPPSPQERSDAAARLRERDARLAADSRTAIERWLGEPLPTESALAKAEPPNPKRRVTEDDARYASVFAALVSEQLERLARVSRTRVRLKRPGRA